MAQEVDHKKGRPNIKDRIGLQEKIIEYYEKNISAATTSRETGYNIKTIYKHYSKISKQVLELQTTNLTERKNVEIAQLISSYECLILKMQQILDNAFDNMSILKQENKPMPKHLIGDITRITNHIAELNEKKYNLSLNIVSIDKGVPEKDENEDLIKKIIRRLTMDRGVPQCAFTQREIIQEIIDFTKCDVSRAEFIFWKMMGLGLDTCSRDDMDLKFAKKYFLLPFATTRDYISNEEMRKIMEDAANEEMNEILEDPTEDIAN